MRVLVVHNEYQSATPSGENQVVNAEVAMLRDAGIDVDTYFRCSDEIDAFGPAQRALLAVRPIYSIEDTRAIRDRIRATRPDVLHLHNPFPLISPAVVRVAHHEGVPVVQTVHNYRHSCPTGLFFRDGRPCEDCSGRLVPFPAVLHGCYRSSRSKSAAMATAAAAHRATWRLVDRFLPVSDFVAQHLERAGISRAQITVRPNSAADHGAVQQGRGIGFVFVGRLTREKGISLLMSAWEQSHVWQNHRLVVAGDGPERDDVLRLADRNVVYLGAVEHEQVAALIDDAAIVVIPSLCYEGFPRLVAEAFERGRPVAATALGALKALITPDVGWTAPAEPQAFARMLELAASDPSQPDKSVVARSRYEATLTPAATLASLLEVYDEVGTGRSGRALS